MGELSNPDSYLAACSVHSPPVAGKLLSEPHIINPFSFLLSHHHLFKVSKYIYLFYIIILNICVIKNIKYKKKLGRQLAVCIRLLWPVNCCLSPTSRTFFHFFFPALFLNVVKNIDIYIYFI